MERKRFHGQEEEVSEEQPASNATAETKPLYSTVLQRNLHKTEAEEEKEAQKEAELTNITFFAGNPAVEIIKGKLHLYRDSPKTSETPIRGTLPSTRGNIVAVLAVPSYMSPAEFCTLLHDYLNDIQHLRVIRDSSPNRYMAVIQFGDQAKADQFYLEFNGTPFSSLEPEVCHVGFVSRVEFIEPATAQLFPASSGQQTELPTCPVCLERMDASVSGILTVLCNHSFHCKCLAKWRGDSSCPVCRYVHDPPESSSACFDCGAKESLWICLLCGNIGCGRYSSGHASQHFQRTHHAYALELETQRVWDYAGDGYVHRLIQNKADGKLVELPGPNPSSDARSTDGKELAKLEDAMALEYTKLLAAQLDAQRQFYEEQLAVLNARIAEAEAALEGERAAVDRLRAEYERRVVAERHRAEAKLDKMRLQLADVSKERDSLRESYEASQRAQREHKHRLDELEKRLAKGDAERERRVRELEEHVRDLMFYIEAQQKVAAQADKEEIQTGVLLVTEPSPPPRGQTTPSKHKNKKRKEKRAAAAAAAGNSPSEGCGGTY